MGQFVLFILLFSGVCTLSSCLPRLYHFVNENKTWTEAQSHCREHYTDLATIDNMEEMNKLIVVGSSYYGGAWIGLEKGDSDRWQWSLTGTDFYREGEAAFTNWGQGQPDNKMCADLSVNCLPTDCLHRDNCVQMRDGLWYDVGCKESHPFICYDGTYNSKEKYTRINKKNTWREAQRYCREHHTDLVSVRNQTENQQIRSLAAGEAVWIGLFRDCWKWSDQSNSSFRYWRSEIPDNYGGNENCAITWLTDTDQGRWGDKPCSHRYPLVCYEVNELKRRQIMRVEMTPGENVDLNNPAVKAAILEQIKQKLKEQGLPEDTKLTWREQPDGKVFHEKNVMKEKNVKKRGRRRNKEEL